jgi:ADP-heptose:LPS heptosyltransferase
LVWVGSSADKLWIAELLAGIPAASADNSISWVGETTLPQLHTLFQHIDYFVGSDSVALHLANAYAQEHPHSRLKLVGLFGATKPSRTGTTVNPTNGVSTLLQAQIPLPCMPCHHKTCIFPVTDTRNHMACMQNLAPQQVMDVVMNASG